MERDKILEKNSNNRDNLINKRLSRTIEVCEVDRGLFHCRVVSILQRSLFLRVPLTRNKNEFIRYYFQ